MGSSWGVQLAQEWNGSYMEFLGWAGLGYRGSSGFTLCVDDIYRVHLCLAIALLTDRL